MLSNWVIYLNNYLTFLLHYLEIMNNLVFKFKFILIFIIINCNYSFSQNYHTVSGTIKDSTNATLAYVNIYLSNKSISTISNAEGLYKFSFPKNLTNDTLIFSCLGYNTKKIPINELLKLNELNIVLEQSPYLLNEVVVNNKQLTATQILKIAKKKYYSDFIPSEDYNANMYFREYVKEDSNYVRAKEAVIKTYSKANKEDVEIKTNKCRFSANTQSYTYNKGDLGLGYIFEFSWFLNNNSFYFKGKINDTKKDTVIFYHNKLVYVLSWVKGNSGEKLKNLYLSNIGNEYAFYNNIKNSNERYAFEVYLISVTDFKIEKIFKYVNFGGVYKSRYKSTGEYVSLFNCVYSTEFIERNNKMYPYHLYYFFKSYISHVLSKTVLKSGFNELINNEIITNNVEIIPDNSFDKTLTEFYINNECKDDDPEFWKTYNYLPNDKLRQEVLESIGKQKSKKQN